MLQTAWRGHGPISTALLPLAWLFGSVARRRRLRLEAHRLPGPLPVVVVGNLTVGGSGKTPLVVALARLCRRRGIRCGIVSRGYGGRAQRSARRVGVDDDPAEVGDEPVMLSRLTGVPVVVCTSRRLAVIALAARGDVDLVIADDGLQHYAMDRAAEVCVIDARAGLGNGRLLPAGPLREPVERLAHVDLIALRGDGDEGSGDPPPGIEVWPSGAARGSFTLVPDRVVSLDAEPMPPMPPSALDGLRAHAVAGIGRPERLFETLRALGADIIPHAFADHHRYRAADLAYPDTLPIITTSKDAVKIARLHLPGRCVLELTLRVALSPALERALSALLERVKVPEDTRPVP